MRIKDGLLFKSANPKAFTLIAVDSGGIGFTLYFIKFTKSQLELALSITNHHHYLVLYLPGYSVWYQLPKLRVLPTN